MLAPMNTTDEAAAIAATPLPTAAQAEPAALETPPPGTDTDEVLVAPETERNPLELLSPAVRRLVRQYDLDITGIHGTGPAGRIRVGDVIGVLGGRAETSARGAEEAPSLPVDSDERPAISQAGQKHSLYAAATAAADEPITAEDAAPHSGLTTTVFECDLSRVLSHRKKQRGSNVELLLTSYFLVAYEQALKSATELTAGGLACFGVELTTADGEPHSLLIDTATIDNQPLEERVHAVDSGLRANIGADLAEANLLVYHYGASGSLIATPTPIGPGHAGSLGIGRVRREIVVQNVDGQDAPRVTALCHLSLSFLPKRIALHRANRFLADAVRILEQWPE
jgi:pyruvate/2-oxoglutarate dehydrogenase complex dihydrolipoamide acyltransferase (E2) component